jgi:hypothetical protein
MTENTLTEKKRKRTISSVKREISALDSWVSISYHPRVRALIEQIRKENQVKIKELQKELVELEANKKPPKPRWPDDIPESVLAFCKAHWKGTTEYDSFRIHCWNEKAVWTSYPSGGYSTAGGWNPTPAGFHLLSFTGKAIGGGAEILEDLEGRVSLKQMNEILKTKGV